MAFRSPHMCNKAKIKLKQKFCFCHISCAQLQAISNQL